MYILTDCTKIFPLTSHEQFCNHCFGFLQSHSLPGHSSIKFVSCLTLSPPRRPLGAIHISPTTAPTTFHRPSRIRFNNFPIVIRTRRPTITPSNPVLTQNTHKLSNINPHAHNQRDTAHPKLAKCAPKCAMNL